MNAAGFFLSVIITEKIVRLQMRGSYLSPVLSSLSCVLVSHAGDSAPIFFFALPKKKTAARRRKLCIARFHAGVKTDSRRCVSFPPHKRCGWFVRWFLGTV